MGMGILLSGCSPPVSLEIGPALGTALRKMGMARLKKAYSGGVWLAMLLDGNAAPEPDDNVLSRDGDPAETLTSRRSRPIVAHLFI